ncbi:MAG: ATP phosphoribosyltransferase regulatory subunit [Clostridia bacterium]|nr:ATP phosphoribosyltransferase regulatory subunit [Clostridia bacterium]
MNTTILKNEEKVLFGLRNLFGSYGYSRFKMSKFEEYELYVRNKDFLVSDSVITFTDTNGRLMALKPDVTLSIVKNTKETDGVQRLYYDENVYRVSDKTHAYKEILQAGLECIGDLDEYNLCEVLLLAAKSLELISDDCALNISHLGVTSALLERPELRPIRRELMTCIGEKNSHGIASLCAKRSVDTEITQKLQLLTETYGPADEVLPKLAAAFTDETAQSALAELKTVTAFLEQVGSVRVWVDFSLVSNMNYYNGLVFRGFVKGVPTGVLSGGQYDNLMKRMHKNARAIGFAVYLDLLERMTEEKEFDVDVLLTYTDATPIQTVLDKAAELTEQGNRVSVQKRIPEKLTYGRLMELK